MLSYTHCSGIAWCILLFTFLLNISSCCIFALTFEDKQRGRSGSRLLLFFFLNCSTLSCVLFTAIFIAFPWGDFHNRGKHVDGGKKLIFLNLLRYLTPFLEYLLHFYVLVYHYYWYLFDFFVTFSFSIINLGILIHLISYKIIVIFKF